MTTLRWSRTFFLATGIMSSAAMVHDVGGQTPGKFERPGKPREGLFYFGFADFGQDHVENTLPCLEGCGFKGTFYTSVGGIKPGSPLWNKIREMARSGHCFVDHTLEHRAADWGDTPNPTEWLRQTTESLRLFREAGVEIHGWWQPGGPGAKYTPAIHDFLKGHYRWAWAQHAAYPGRHRPLHWHFDGDRYSFVIGCGGGMDYAKDQAEAQRSFHGFQTAAADAVAQGLVVLYGGHHTPPGIKQWGLEQTCRWVRKAGFPTVTLNEAVYACTHSREFYSESVEQMPNAALQLDRDGNGRPDGWFGCAYVPEGTAGRGKRAMSIVGSAARTTLYGPEPGRNRLCLSARNSSGEPAKLTVAIQAVMVGDDSVDRPETELVHKALVVTKDWQTVTADVNVAERTDRLRIHISSGPGNILLAEPSFRRVADGAVPRRRASGP